MKIACLIKQLCVLVIACFCGVFISCATLQQLLQKPVVTFDRVDFSNVSFTESTVHFRYKITNPNPVGISIRKATYNLKLNDKQFLQGVFDEGITIKADGSAPLDIPLTIQYFDFFKSIQDFLTSDDVNYDLSGVLSVGPFEIPYNKKGSFSVPKLPQISLSGVKIKKLSFTEAALAFTVKLKNANAFELQPQSLNYSLALANVQFAQGDVTNISSVQSNGETFIEIPLSVNILKMGRAAYNLLAQQSTSYNVTGDLKFAVPQQGIKEFPFAKSGRVSLSR